MCWHSLQGRCWKPAGRHYECETRKASTYSISTFVLFVVTSCTQFQSQFLSAGCPGSGCPCFHPAVNHTTIFSKDSTANLLTLQHGCYRGGARDRVDFLPIQWAILGTFRVFWLSLSEPCCGGCQNNDPMVLELGRHTFLWSGAALCGTEANSCFFTAQANFTEWIQLSTQHLALQDMPR